MTLEMFKQNQATWDHVVPVARGGSDSPKNKKLACSRCNNEKSDLPLAVFIAMRNNNIAAE